jgi:hypothetical protein
MEPFTVDRNFKKQNIIDEFGSIIWTERYYGDSAVELVVPATPDMFRKLPLGIFLGLDKSDEIMILETMNVEEGNIKFQGISALHWMNNRFVRTSAAHEDRYWYLEGAPGWLLWQIIYNMCVGTSPYLNGTIPIGIDNPQLLAIPGLGLRDYDNSGSAVKVGIPYGPVYDSMKEIATTYQLGMQIVLDSNEPFPLGFRSYYGLDRTSGQTQNMPVRFSPQMDSFADIKELQSMAEYKTLVYAFAPSNPDGLATTPGKSSMTGMDYTGFDLRAALVFAEDITTDMVGASPANLVSILNSRAFDKRADSRFIKAVDGEIVPDNQFQYGDSLQSRRSYRGSRKHRGSSRCSSH